MKNSIILSIDNGISAATELHQTYLIGQEQARNKGLRLAIAVYALAEALRADPDELQTFIVSANEILRRDHDEDSLFALILHWLVAKAGAKAIRSGTMCRIARICAYAWQHGITANQMADFVAGHGGFARTYAASVDARRGMAANDNGLLAAGLAEADQVAVVGKDGSLHFLKVGFKDVGKLIRRYGIVPVASNDNLPCSNDNDAPKGKSPSVSDAIIPGVQPVVATNASPLQHMGGKAKVAKTLRRFCPVDSSVHTYIDAFGGAASFAVALKRMEHSPFKRFLIRDTFSPLINFWTTLQASPHELIREAQSLFGFADDPKAIYEQCISSIRAWMDDGENGIRAAAAYYIHSHTCHPAALFKLRSNSFAASKQGWMVTASRSLGKLLWWSELIQGWDFRVQDYRTTLAEATAIGEGAFLFVDPPYEAMTGKSSPTDIYRCTFSSDDHDHLAVMVNEAAKEGVKTMATINHSEANRLRYAGHNRFLRTQVYGAKEPGTNTSKVGLEMVVLTYDLPSMQDLASNANWSFAEAE